MRTSLTTLPAPYLVPVEGSGLVARKRRVAPLEVHRLQLRQHKKHAHVCVCDPMHQAHVYPRMLPALHHHVAHGARRQHRDPLQASF